MLAEDFLDKRQTNALTILLRSEKGREQITPHDHGLVTKSAAPAFIP